MKENNDLIAQVAQEVATSSTNSAIEAGQANSSSPELIDAINQVFALFRVNYHNQFYSAYTDTDLLNQAKRLCLDTLCYFTEKQILQGAKKIISTSEYLPTLNRMLECCEMSDKDGELPSPEKAYTEACTAGSPKSDFKWTHLAVYYAGKETGWYKLRNDSTSTSYPIFLENYRRICREISQGKSMPHLISATKKNKLNSQLSNEQLKINLRILKKERGFD